MSNDNKANDSQNQCSHKERDAYDKINTGIAVVGLFVLIAYTTFAGIQSCLMRKAVTANNAVAIAAQRSAEAVQTQVSVTRSQLEAGQRPRFEPPSVAPQFAAFQKPTVGGGKPQERVTFSATNVGNGVAYRLSASGFWYQPAGVKEARAIDLDVISSTPATLAMINKYTVKISEDVGVAILIPADVWATVGHLSANVFIIYERSPA